MVTMQKYKNQTVKRYLNNLSAKTPTPGGGSAAALAGAIGVALISMVANYSKGRSKARSVEARIRRIARESERIRKRLLELVDLDAQVYCGVVKARNGSAAVKESALRKAQKVPLEVSSLCYKAVQLTPLLVKKGNPNLVSDVAVAIELLLAAFNSAMINVKINQT